MGITILDKFQILAFLVFSKQAFIRSNDVLWGLWGLELPVFLPWLHLKEILFITLEFLLGIRTLCFRKPQVVCLTKTIKTI